jgi:hypothetical protein
MLIEAGLIEHKTVKVYRLKKAFSKPKRVIDVYHLTEKGHKFLELHKNIIELMPPELVVVAGAAAVRRRITTT